MGTRFAGRTVRPSDFADAVENLCIIRACDSSPQMEQAIMTTKRTTPTPSTTPFEVGTLKNRYGPVGSWASLEFEGRFGFLQDPNGVASE